MKKTCFKCKTEKPLGDYYRHPKTADGYLNKCKECAKADQRKHYHNEQGKVRSYYRDREKTAKRKEQRRLKQKTSRARHPDKWLAYQMVRNAIKSGKLIRLPCEKCGDPKSQGHHDDYSKPLDVRWLCFKHHREHHGHIVVNQESQRTT